MEGKCLYVYNSSFESGYDIPVYSVGHLCFDTIHITAIVCLLLSFTAANVTVVALFKSKRRLTFMKWQKHERFLIYRCICDVAHGFVHTLDHFQILLTKDHVRPKTVCQFYALVITSVCLSAASLSLVSALNAFVSVYLKKNISFGQKDWKLLTVLFGGPFAISLIVLMLDVLGPSGFFCLFDSVKGVLANAILTTGVGTFLLICVATLYILTWRKIYIEATALQNQCIDSRVARSARLKSAKAMCLFVFVYIIQWTSVCIYGTWQLISEVPFGLFMSVVVMTNVGGVLSGFIFLANMSRQNSVSNYTTEQKIHSTTITVQPSTLK